MRVFKYKDMHIDLDSITAIGDAYFNNRMGSGGWYVGHVVHLKLHDKPLNFERQLDDNESEWVEKDFFLLMADGSRIESRDAYNVEEGTLAQKNMQEEVDHLIHAWKHHLQGVIVPDERGS